MSGHINQDDSFLVMLLSLQEANFLMRGITTRINTSNNFNSIVDFISTSLHQIDPWKKYEPLNVTPTDLLIKFSAIALNLIKINKRDNIDTSKITEIIDFCLSHKNRDNPQDWFKRTVFNESWFDIIYNNKANELEKIIKKHANSHDLNYPPNIIEDIHNKGFFNLIFQNNSFIKGAIEAFERNKRSICGNINANKIYSASTFFLANNSTKNKTKRFEIGQKIGIYNLLLIQELKNNNPNAINFSGEEKLIFSILYPNNVTNDFFSKIMDIINIDKYAQANPVEFIKDFLNLSVLYIEESIPSTKNNTEFLRRTNHVVKVINNINYTHLSHDDFTKVIHSIDEEINNLKKNIENYLNNNIASNKVDRLNKLLKTFTNVKAKISKNYSQTSLKNKNARKII